MRFAVTLVSLCIASGAAYAQHCEKWEWYKNRGGKEWKDTLTYRCIKDVPKDNRRPVFFVGSVGN